MKQRLNNTIVKKINCKIPVCTRSQFDLFVTLLTVALQSAAMSPTRGLVRSGADRAKDTPLDQSSMWTHQLLNVTCPATRRKKQSVPLFKKDAAYWNKRHKNNEAAKRSRERKRLNDLMLKSQLLALRRENMCLRAQMRSMQAVSPSASTTSPAWPLSPKALCQAGLWGNPAPVQESVSRPFEDPGFRGANSVAQQSIFPLTGPHEHPPQAAGTDAQQRLLYPSEYIASEATVCNNLWQPWRSSPLTPIAVYTSRHFFSSEDSAKSDPTV